MKEGYYWVIHYPGDRWEIALLTEAGYWKLHDNPYVLSQGDFHRVGIRIDRLTHTHT